ARSARSVLDREAERGPFRREVHLSRGEYPLLLIVGIAGNQQTGPGGSYEGNGAAAPVERAARRGLIEMSDYQDRRARCFSEPGKWGEKPTDIMVDSRVHRVADERHERIDDDEPCVKFGDH